MGKRKNDRVAKPVMVQTEPLEKSPQGNSKLPVSPYAVDRASVPVSRFLILSTGSNKSAIILITHTCSKACSESKQ